MTMISKCAFALCAVLAYAALAEELPPPEAEQSTAECRLMDLTVNPVEEATIKQTVKPANPLPTAFAVFGDGDENFDMDAWLDSLESKPSGIYVKRGQAYIVSHLGENDEPQTLSRLRAKANAIAIMREHFPDLPQKIEGLAMRTAAALDDGGILAVKIEDLINLAK